MTPMLDPCHIWNVIYNARSNRCHHQNSPNTAPVTQKESHFFSSHMKPHLQCAEQLVSPSNLTKYCACRTKRLTFWVLITYETSFPMRGATGVTIQPHQILRLPRKMALQDLKKISKNRWNVISNAGTIRAWSDHDPSMIRPWKRKPQPASPPRLLFELTTSIFYWKIQCFAPNLTFKPSPNTAPATKSDTSTSRSTAPATKSDTWTSPSTAPATKSDTWTSPNTAPATKSDTWTSPNTAPATKNDAYAWSSYETSFPMRRATGVTIEPHQILRLARKMTLQDLRKSPKTGETSFPMRGRSEHDPTMIRAWSDHDPTMKTQTATRLATEVTFRAHHEHFLLKKTTFRAQSYIQTFTKYCACHEKWH